MVIDGFKYWTMGYPIWLDPHVHKALNTCLINRKPVVIGPDGVAVESPASNLAACSKHQAEA